MYFIHATYMLLTYLSITSHASMAREFHGFRNPQGLWVGYTGVRVWVANFVPSQNPYPQDEGTGFGGFLPRVFEAKAQAFILDFSALTVVL